MALSSILSSSSISYFDITYLKEDPEYDHEKPYYVSGNLPPESEPFRTNIQYETRGRLPVADLRGNEDQLHLATHGFQYLDLPREIVELDVRGAHRLDYIERVTSLVKTLLNATFALCYDCKVCSMAALRRGLLC